MTEEEVRTPQRSQQQAQPKEARESASKAAAAGNGRAGAGVSGGTVKLDRDALLERLGAAIERAFKKVETGRVYDPKAERLRVEYLRVLGYLCATFSGIIKDAKEEELERRLSALESVLRIRNGGKK